MSVDSIIKKLIKIISVAAVIVTGCIGVGVFGADVSMILIMSAFMLFYVMLPGCLLIDVSGLRCDHISTFLIRGFFAGFALNLILYFISELIRSDLLLYIACPVLSAVLLARLFRKGAFRSLSLPALLDHIPASLFLFAALVFIYSFATTQGTYIPPYKAAFSAIKLDSGFHAGIINALAEGFPPKNPWVAEKTITYHFFTEMLYSIPVRLFGVHSEEVLMSYTAYTITPVLSCALYSFFREFTADKKRSGLYCLSLMLSNMFILKAFPSSWFLYHLFSNINNAGMGVAGMLTALPVLKAWDAPVTRDSERFCVREVVFLSVITMLTTGIKGPMGVVVVAGMVGTVILGAILRKIDWRVIPATVITIASFIFIYVYIVGARGVGQTNSRGGTLLNPWEVTDIFFLKGRILNSISQRSIALPVLLIVFVLVSLSAFALPFILGYIRELFLVLSGRKSFCFSKVTVYAACAVGYIALLVLNYSGHSQVYFGFAALILVPVISFWYLEDLQKTKTRFTRAVNIIFIVCLCLASVTTAQYLLNVSEKAYSNYERRDKDRTHYRNVSSLEYEGLEWLRENTDEDALIASDRYYSVSLDDYNSTSRSHNTHFAYAIYSERNQYLEGSGFTLPPADYELRADMIRNIKKMMDPANENRGDLARSLNVDYIFVSNRFNDTGDLSNEDYTLVFDNEDVDIYEVNDSPSM